MDEITTTPGTGPGGEDTTTEYPGDDGDSTTAEAITETPEPTAAAFRSRRQLTKAFVHAPPPTHHDVAAQVSFAPLTNGDTEPLISPRSHEIAVQTSIEKYEMRDLRSVRNVATATASTSTSSRRTSSRRNSSRNQSHSQSHSLSHNPRRSRLPALFRFDDEDVKTYSTLGSSRDDEDGDEKKCE